MIDRAQRLVGFNQQLFVLAFKLPSVAYLVNQRADDGFGCRKYFQYNIKEKWDAIPDIVKSWFGIEEPTEFLNKATIHKKGEFSNIVIPKRL